MAPNNPGDPRDPRPGDPNYGDLGRDAEREIRRGTEGNDHRREQGRTYGFSEPERRNNNWWWLLLPLAALAAWGIWALANNDDKKDMPRPSPTPTLSTPTPTLSTPTVTSTPTLTTPTVTDTATLPTETPS